MQVALDNIYDNPNLPIWCVADDTERSRLLNGLLHDYWDMVMLRAHPGIIRQWVREQSLEFQYIVFVLLRETIGTWLFTQDVEGLKLPKVSLDSISGYIAFEQAYQRTPTLSIASFFSLAVAITVRHRKYDLTLNENLLDLLAVPLCSQFTTVNMHDWRLLYLNAKAQRTFIDHLVSILGPPNAKNVCSEIATMHTKTLLRHYLADLGICSLSADVRKSTSIQVAALGETMALQVYEQYRTLSLDHQRAILAMLMVQKKLQVACQGPYWVLQSLFISIVRERFPFSEHLHMRVKEGSFEATQIDSLKALVRSSIRTRFANIHALAAALLEIVYMTYASGSSAPTGHS